MGEKFKCSLCFQNPNFKEAWKCLGFPQNDNNVQVEVEGGIKYIYRSCPNLFIPPSIKQFCALHSYNKKFNIPFKGLNKISLRYLLAVTYLDSKVEEYMKEKKGQGQ